MKMDKLIVEKPGKPQRTLDVIGASLHEGKGQILVSVEGVMDRDAAEALAGYLVTVDPEERVELPEGEYWIDSLIGLEVRDVESDATLGMIEDVLTTTSNDVYRVRTPNGELKLIPAVGEVVREIDLTTGLMRIHVIEGLLD